MNSSYFYDFFLFQISLIPLIQIYIFICCKLSNFDVERLGDNEDIQSEDISHYKKILLTINRTQRLMNKYFFLSMSCVILHSTFDTIHFINNIIENPTGYIADYFWLVQHVFVLLLLCDSSDLVPNKVSSIKPD